VIGLRARKSAERLLSQPSNRIDRNSHESNLIRSVTLRSSQLARKEGFACRGAANCLQRNTVERSPAARIARCPAAIAAADNRDLGALPSVGG
jgi:hypothetical protein